MASKRKPAITNVARPQGWVDDIIGTVGKAIGGKGKKSTKQALKSAGVDKRAAKKYLKSGGPVPSGRKDGMRGTMITQSELAKRKRNVR